MTEIENGQTTVNDSRTQADSDTDLTRENLASFFELPTSRGPILVDRSDEEMVRGFSWYAVPADNGRAYAHARVPKSD